MRSRVRLRRLPPAFVLAAAIVLALATAGCGGESSSDGGSTSSGAAADSAPGRSGHPSEASRPSIAEEEEQAGDQSIQEYGAEAAGGEREAVAAAARSFFGALADSDYAKVCAGLTSANRGQLQQYLKLGGGEVASCAAVLAKILSVPSSEASKAARATVSRVRIADGNAFILFRPAGGKLSYFVMKDEDGAWKATSIAPGTPLSP